MNSDHKKVNVIICVYERLADMIFLNTKEEVFE